MKLRYFDVERFGIWNNFRLDGLQNGLQVIYGPNGSGKTTLMQFVRAVFYGRAPQHSARFLPSVHAGSQGGRIGTSVQDREYIVNRFWESSVGSDAATVSRPDGSIHDSLTLRQILGEVDESVFNSVFTVGYREVEDFDLLVREALSDAASIRTASEELASVNRALGEVDDSEQKLQALQSDRDRIHAEIARLSSHQPVAPAEFARVRDAIGRLEALIREIQQRLQHIDREIARCEARAAARLTHRSGTNANGERVRELEARIANWRNWQREIEEQLAGVRNEIHHAALRDCDPVDQIPQTQMFRARGNMTRIENQITALQTRLTELKGSNGDSSIQAFQSDLSEIRDQVFRLCDDLGQQEVLDEIAALQAEEIQLTRCRTELDRQLSIMLRRRRVLLHEFSGGAREAYDGYRHENQATCQSCSHEPAPAPAATEPAVDDELRGFIAQREQTCRELERAREELAAMGRQFTELERRIRDGDVARQLESLRFDLSVIDEQLRRARADKDVRTTTRVLLEELRDDYESRGGSLVLTEASEYLRLLTDHQHNAIVANSDSRTISVQRADGTLMSLGAMSRGGRDQVALSLRLALARSYARRGTRLPLILDDVFITSDSDRAEATARLLRDFADENQQILFFTCHEHTADMFRRIGVPVRTLPPAQTARPEISRPVMQPLLTPTVPAESLVVKAFPGEAGEFEGELKVRDVEFEPTQNWIFYTELSTPVGDLSGLPPEQAHELENSGVYTMEDLLALVPDAAAIRLSHLGLTPEEIRNWQAQALLSCRVPMLHRRDAELLVLCGIMTPERLAEMHPNNIFESVSAFLRSSQGRRFVRDSNPFDRQTAINWVRWAAHARTLWQSRERESQSRRVYSGVLPRSSDGNGSSATAVLTRPAGTRTRSKTARSSESRAQSDRSRSRRSGRSLATRRRTDRGTSRSTRAATQREDQPTRELKFYLKQDAPVEDAPSIGPRTAERLAGIDIVTVRDLLAANPEAAAEQLNHRRIKADTLRTWQAQAMMVCRIPELRGHDAQILIACEIETPEELATLRPADLFARVAPFVETSEGERIVRNGKKPDLEEITFWIDCSKQARELHEA